MSFRHWSRKLYHGVFPSTISVRRRSFNLICHFFPPSQKVFVKKFCGGQTSKMPSTNIEACPLFFKALQIPDVGTVSPQKFKGNDRNPQRHILQFWDSRPAFPNEICWPIWSFCAFCFKICSPRI